MNPPGSTAAPDRPAGPGRGAAPAQGRPTLAWRLVAWAAVAAALAAVFLAYLNPHLVADLANRVWACF